MGSPKTKENKTNTKQKKKKFKKNTQKNHTKNKTKANTIALNLFIISKNKLIINHITQSKQKKNRKRKRKKYQTQEKTTVKIISYPNNTQILSKSKRI